MKYYFSKEKYKKYILEEFSFDKYIFLNLKLFVHEAINLPSDHGMFR